MMKMTDPVKSTSQASKVSLSAQSRRLIITIVVLGLIGLNQALPIQDGTQEPDKASDEESLMGSLSEQDPLDTATLAIEEHYQPTLSEQLPQSIRNEVETYERVVLEGSSVRLKCPQARTTFPWRPFFSREPYMADKQRKKLAYPIGLMDVSHPVSNQIKWFKNHVPLVNLNHSLHGNDQSVPLSRRQDDPRTIFRLQSKPMKSIDGQYEIQRKSNHLTVITKQPALKSRTFDDRQKEMDRTEAEMLVQDEGGSLLSPTSARNVNEFVSSEKHGAWYINNIDELVINRVSRRHAGKYTCLSGAKWSEIILDVLGASDLGESSDQSYRVSEHDLSREGLDENKLGIFNGSDNNMSRNDNNQRSHHWKNVSFEQLADTTTTHGPGHFVNSYRAQKQPSWKISRDSIDVEFTSSNLRLDDSDDETSDSTDNPNDGLHYERSGHLNQVPHLILPHHAHELVGETMRPADLESIPGFLYTKQRLICPGIGYDFLNLDHIMSYFEVFCDSLGPRSAIFIQKTSSNGGRNCRAFAEELTQSLLLSIKEPNSCMSSIFDLLWLKDGRKIQFYQDGRGKDMMANVKLIRYERDKSASKPHRPADIPRTKQGYSSTRSDGQTSRTNHLVPDSLSELTCVTPGRILEIEGLGKENAGHYSCAYQLSLSKMKSAIPILKELHGTDETSAGNLSRPTDSDAVDNDTACCDQISSSTQKDRPRQEFENNIPPTERAIDYLAAMDRSDLTSSNYLPEEVSEEPSKISLPTETRLKVSQELVFDFYNKAFDLVNNESPKKHELIPFVIQTFSLSIVERSANSCDLWLTIDKASEAYTRRKLVDYNELRGSSRRKQAKSLHHSEASSVDDGDDDDDGWTAVGYSDKLDHSIVGPKSVPEQGTVKISQPDKQIRAPLLSETTDDDELLNNSVRKSATKWVWQVMGTLQEPSESDVWESSDYVNGGEATNLTEENYEKTDDPGLRQATIDGDLIHHGGGRGPVDQAGQMPSIEKRRRRDLGSVEPDHQEQIVGMRSGNRRVEESITQNGQDEGNRDAIGGVPLETNVRMNTNELGVLRRKPVDSENRWHRITGRQNVYDFGGNQITIDRHREARLWHPAVIDGSTETEASKTATQVIDKLLRVDESIDGLAPEIGLVRGRGSWGEQRGLRSPSGQLESHALRQDSSSIGLNPKLAVDDGEESRKSETKQPSASQPATGAESKSSGGKYDSRSVLADDKIDESLMWRASQYLYMHMRATAASSAFGLEVSVEWSNERINGSASLASSKPPSELDNGQLEEEDDDDDQKESRELAQSPFVRKFDGQNPSLEQQQQQQENDVLRDKTPFATIDVIAGQSLQLQCLAQAFGRLPDIKWYKRVDSIPSRLKTRSGLARRIGHDIFWPLTELEALDDAHDPLRRFVCSQTITVFDDLTNQTFTSINRLDISQYNDLEPDDGPVKTDSLSTLKHNKLYACIVDADIRHNYATLGVNLVNAPEKLTTQQLDKRLKARDATESGEQQADSQQDVAIDQLPAPIMMSGVYPEYGLYRDSELKFPLESSYWIPIQNKSRLGDRPGELSLISPVTVSGMIGLVLLSLLALVYVTLKSYRKLTRYQFDEEILASEPSDDEELFDNKRVQYFGEPIGQAKLKTSHDCCCQLEESVGPVWPLDSGGMNKNHQAGEFNYCLTDIPTNAQQFYDCSAKQCTELSDNHHSLYQAHEHDINTNCIYHDLRMVAPHSGSLESAELRDYLFNGGVLDDGLIAQSYIGESEGHRRGSDNVVAHSANHNLSIYVNLLGEHLIEGIDETTAYL